MRWGLWDQEVQQMRATGSGCLGDLLLLLSSLADEVASFLLYVKALDYQEKPDYQRLRRMLSSGARDGAGRLDFSLPGGGAGEGTSYLQEAPTSSRDQVRTTVAEVELKRRRKKMEEHWRRRERKRRTRR